MKSYTNTKLRKKLQNKGIILDEKKKQHFDKYSYYQVINAYKNIFSTSIENINDIENNIKNSIDIDRYRKNFSISNDWETIYKGKELFGDSFKIETIHSKEKRKEFKEKLQNTLEMAL